MAHSPKDPASDERRELCDFLGVPHRLQLVPVDFNPGADHFLGPFGKIAFDHFSRQDVKFTDILTIDGMNVAGLVFFRLEEHLDNNSIKPRDFRHFNITPLLYGCMLTLEKVFSNM